jgi:hypothetical protein
MKAQIHVFSGKVSFGLPRVGRRFVEESLFGIAAGQSLRLSQWGRSLQEKIPLVKTVTRLSRQLNRDGLWYHLTSKVLSLARDKIGSRSLLVLDLSDISKSYARKMEYLSCVHDGSRQSLSEGYWLIQVIAGESGQGEVMPLYSRLYSTVAPDFEAENTEIIKAVTMVSHGIGGKGIWVIDRGGDRRKLYDFFLSRKLDFIIRLKGDRHVVYQGKKVVARELSGRCRLLYREVLIREESQGEKRYDIDYGFCPVRLPDIPVPLFLVVVSGFGREPMMLLTTVPLRRSRAALWWVVQSYLTRWKVEETLRFIKQSYQLEDVRVLTYRRLQNMMALVLAVAYFTMTYLTRRLKLKALSRLLLKASRRIFGIPEFRYYAVSDGIKELLKHTNTGPLGPPRWKPPQYQFSLFNP